MKKLFVLILSAICLNVTAQQSMELGVNVGTSTYLGDLKTTAYTLEQNAISLGLQGRYNFNSRIAGRVSLGYGTIMGDDRKTERLDLRARNLSFRSRLYEMAFIGEVNLLNFGDHKLNKRGRQYFRMTPYVFGGMALFHFNPEARYNGRWQALQPLGTEGQDIPNSNVASYNLTQISLPIGIGLKLQLEPNIILSYEIGWRKTFTDYLDDVSGRYFDEAQIAANNGAAAADLSYRGDELAPGSTAPVGSFRGDPDNKDWYILSNFTISYKLFRTRSGNFTKKY